MQRFFRATAFLVHLCLLVVFALPITTLAATPTADVIPDDTFWEKQWYLRQIQAPQAWAVTTGSRQVIVAVIDGGVDINHADLQGNIWTNMGEIPDDGIDNDQDGFVDDVHGWNFVTQKGDVRPVFKVTQYEDAWSHGTLVASLIGSRGNDGLGIAGVTWHVRLMPVVVLNGDGEGSVRNVIQAVRYAVNHGAHIINLSLAGYDYDEELDQLIRNAANAGVVIVAATGNDDVGSDGLNTDDAPVYPACMDAGNNIVLGVSGTDTLDQKAPYANYGKLCTDISAPAQELFGARPSYPHDAGRATSTVMGYIDKMTGTSLAAPLVSGVAALIKSVRPGWTAAQIRERIRLTADSIEDNLSIAEKGGLGVGRLNAGRALAGLYPEISLSGDVVGQPTLTGKGPWTTSTVVGVEGTVWSLLSSKFSPSVTFWNAALGVDRVWQPYGEGYRGGIQQIALDKNGSVLLWPTTGGGHAFVVNVRQAGKVVYRGFPLGTSRSGRWEVRVDKKETTRFSVKDPRGVWASLRWNGTALIRL